MALTLYKYLPDQYAVGMVERGEVLFRSLLYFLACEDARRDELEGTHQFAPVEGLEIHNETRGSGSRLLDGSLLSSVKH